jgi:hypothetical protein
MKHSVVIMIVLLSVPVLTMASSERRRNPFAPLKKKVSSSETKRPENIKPAGQQEKKTTAEKTNLHLNGIIWNKTNPIAIINDTIVTIGSSIADRKVFAISVDYVELQYNDEKEVLKMTSKISFGVSSKKADIKTVSEAGQ